MSNDVSLRWLLYGEDRSASKAVHGVGKEAESTATRVGGAFHKLGGQIGGEFGEALDKVGEGLDAIGEKAHGAGPKLLAAGGALTGIGAAFQLIGSKDKQATDQLKAAVEATGSSVHDYGDEIEKTVKHMENYNHGAADTKQALATLTEATNDPKKALESMGVVADLAAAKHLSLNDAAALVARGLNGQSRVFTQYGIHLAKTKDGTVDVDAAMSQLSTKLSGQAAASVDNFSGKVDVIKTKLGDWTAQVGQKLGPVLTALGPTLMVAGTAAQFMAARQAAAAVATEADTAATEGASLAARGWAAAQWLLNAALDANPIGIIIVAIAALVGGFILAYQHSETFRNIVQGALKAVGDAATALWTDAIRPAFKFIADLWFTVVGALVDGAASAFGWVPGLGGKLKGAAKAFDHFRDDVNSALSGISDKTVHVNADLQIAHDSNANLHTAAPTTIGSARAAGGPVVPSQMYLVGEHGPEVVTFGAAGYVTPNSQSRLLIGAGGGDAGGISITVNGALDPDGVARQIHQLLRRLNTSTGGAVAGYAR